MTEDERQAVFRAIEGGLCDDALLWFVRTKRAAREVWPEYAALMNAAASGIVGRPVTILLSEERETDDEARTVAELDIAGFYTCIRNRWQVIW